MNLLNPYNWIWLFVFSIPWENSVTLPGFGASSFTGLAFLATSFLYIIVTRIDLRIHPYFLTIIVFIAFVAVSSIWSIDADKTIIRTIQYSQITLIFWLVYLFLNSQDKIDNVLFAYVLGAYVSIGNMIWGYVTGRSQYAEIDRFSAEGFNPNDIALVLSIAVPMAWYLSTKFTDIRAVWLCRFYLPLSVFAVVLTGSRGGFLALLVALMIVPLINKNFNLKHLVAIFFVFVISFIAFSRYVPETSLSRISSIQDEIQGGSLTHRRDIWKIGFEQFKDNVLFGVGSGAFPAAIKYSYGKSVIVHNTFLSILYELGVIGFILFLSIFLKAVRNVVSLEVAEKRFLLVLISVWFVGVQGGSWEYNKTTWLIFILPLCFRDALNRFPTTQKSVET